MLVNGADFFLIKPGRFFFTVGSFVTLGLSFGPVTVGPVDFSLYWMLLSATFGLVGLQMVLTGEMASLIYDVLDKEILIKKFKYSFNKVVARTVSMAVLGLTGMSPMIYKYMSSGLSLAGLSEAHRNLAISGLFIISAGFIYFVNSLLIIGMAQRFEN
jgi:hypothetical protein